MAIEKQRAQSKRAKKKERADKNGGWSKALEIGETASIRETGRE